MPKVRITTKIILLCGACILVTLLGALTLLWRMRVRARADEHAIYLAVQMAELARLTQVDFKKQVQEWKDTLLRGYKPGDFDHYLGQFKHEQQLVNAHIAELLATLTDPDARATADKFRELYGALNQHYAEALDIFVRSGRTDFKAADQHVRGEDRAPTDLLDQLVFDVRAQQAQIFTARRMALERERAFILALVLAVAIGMFVASVWITRRITAPITSLTDTISNIANARDYSLRAVSSGTDEFGRLTAVFNRMLDQLQDQNAALEQNRLKLERQLEERKQSEAQMAHSVSLLNATLESTSDGLLVVDLQNRVTAVNRRFGEMWHIPQELIDAGDDQKILAMGTEQLKDPPEFLRKVQHLYGKPDAESFDVLVFKDGRVFERYSRPQRVSGVIVGRVWSFHDITERRKAESELARLDRQLLQAARQAGMAELATGVLHNVGNVLNSVNVASSSVADSLKRSRAANLSKVVALMREREADLGRFLSEDPKGKQLLSYLAQLGEHLTAEQALVLQELADLQKSVEHIKDIITRQQTMSKISTSLEPANPQEMFEDALKMNEGGLMRHGIAVVRRFAPVPTIATDRNQVLQILVNLLRNASQACSASERQPKQVTVGLEQEGGRVRFSVSDTGVGIAPENLDKIFTHGFTTKKDGHGFGLNSCRVIAVELNGNLTVQSDGVGQGATFTLELPAEPRRDTAA